MKQIIYLLLIVFCIFTILITSLSNSKDERLYGHWIIISQYQSTSLINFDKLYFDKVESSFSSYGKVFSGWKYKINRRNLIFFSKKETINFGKYTLNHDTLSFTCGIKLIRNKQADNNQFQFIGLSNHKVSSSFFETSTFDLSLYKSENNELMISTLNYNYTFEVGIGIINDDLIRFVLQKQYSKVIRIRIGKNVNLKDISLLYASLLKIGAAGPAGKIVWILDQTKDNQYSIFIDNINKLWREDIKSNTPPTLSEANCPSRYETINKYDKIVTVNNTSDIIQLNEPFLLKNKILIEVNIDLNLRDYIHLINDYKNSKLLADIKFKMN